MTSYTRDIQPLEADGYTDEQIAMLLGAVTSRKVDLAVFEGQLKLWGVIVASPRNGEWSGPLVDVAESASEVAPVARAVLSWLHTRRGETIDTTQPAIAVAWQQGLAALIAAKVIAAEHEKPLRVLAGPLLHPGLTPEAVAQTRTDHAAAVAAAEAAAAAQAAAAAAEAAREQVRQSIRTATDAAINQINAGLTEDAAATLRTLADQLEA